ncbi:hypothetical protein [Sulfitobacter sp. S190]|uniref:hypothetical protein n=1 Tax=Sulfitobacter sp. S190 TaxID=2867022 RepID=UPI0021A4E29C|nr:hypothetical protein [Sulfitobacter sp. S190]UWR21696.1 hypothetical protein K3756_13515 [Sulfitobacter sp. S190]
MTAATTHAPRTGGRLVLWSAVAVFAVMAMIAALPLATQKTLLTEGGPVETLSVIGYAICIALLFVLWPLAEVARRWYFVVLLALFAGRELDLDKAPFTEGLLKARQYTGDTVGPVELVISAAILLAIILTCLILLRRETGRFIRGLAARSPAAAATLLGVLFIGVYKAIDGLARKLEPFGITVSEDLNNLISVIEEVGELGIPLMFAVAIILSARSAAGGA